MGVQPLSPLYSVQDASLRYGVAHTQRGSSSLSEISLETPSQTRPGVCALGHSKPAALTVTNDRHNTPMCHRSWGLEPHHPLAGG